MSKKSTKCDCLNFCGDDPWLADGRAIPCLALLQDRAAAAERQRICTMAKALAIQAVADGQVTVTAADMTAIQKLL